MSSYFSWKPYVPVARRRRQGAARAAALRKSGHDVLPVEIEGRKIATSFWGAAWCENLESYGDYANRLPRGRTYARNGSVIDLQIAAGSVRSLVSGSDIYAVAIDIAPLPKVRWQAIKARCAGQIGSLVELLRGSVSAGVMEIVTQAGTGLFPHPQEIAMDCSCPDDAIMCKHVAATLYGVGARLDHAPEGLFTLRGVDAGEMVELAVDQPLAAAGSPGDGRVLESDDLSSVFGVDIAGEPGGPGGPAPRRRGRAAPAGSRRRGARSARPAPCRLGPERLQKLLCRTQEFVEASAALSGLVHEVQLTRGRLYLWWEPGELLARITPVAPGSLLLETPRGRAWTEIKRGRLTTVLTALENTP